MKFSCFQRMNFVEIIWWKNPVECSRLPEPPGQEEARSSLVRARDSRLFMLSWQTCLPKSFLLNEEWNWHEIIIAWAPRGSDSMKLIPAKLARVTQSKKSSMFIRSGFQYPTYLGTRSVLAVDLAARAWTNTNRNTCWLVCSPDTRDQRDSETSGQPFRANPHTRPHTPFTRFRGGDKMAHRFVAFCTCFGIIVLEKLPRKSRNRGTMQNYHILLCRLEKEKKLFFVFFPSQLITTH